MNYLTPKLEIPANGIYFFFESGESAIVDGTPAYRIVRVGINTSDSLLGRLQILHLYYYGISQMSSISRVVAGYTLLTQSCLPKL
jgi:hypothetical protein